MEHNCSECSHFKKHQMCIPCSTTKKKDPDRIWKKSNLSRSDCHKNLDLLKKSDLGRMCLQRERTVCSLVHNCSLYVFSLCNFFGELMKFYLIFLFIYRIKCNTIEKCQWQTACLLILKSPSRVKPVTTRSSFSTNQINSTNLKYNLSNTSREQKSGAINSKSLWRVGSWKLTKAGTAKAWKLCQTVPSLAGANLYFNCLKRLMQRATCATV